MAPITRSMRAAGAANRLAVTTIGPAGSCPSLPRLRDLRGRFVSRARAAAAATRHAAKEDRRRAEVEGQAQEEKDVKAEKGVAVKIREEERKEGAGEYGTSHIVIKREGSYQEIDLYGVSDAES